MIKLTAVPANSQGAVRASESALPPATDSKVFPVAETAAPSRSRQKNTNGGATAAVIRSARRV
jgi:hypothetical protein